MLRRSVILSAAALLSVCLLWQAAIIHAQENEKAASKERRGPLPFYFGKLGVSETQREKLYDIQDSYEARLEELRKEMKRLLAERDEKMEELLTPGQKLRLQELKAEAAKKDKGGQKPATDSGTE